MCFEFSMAIGLGPGVAEQILNKGLCGKVLPNNAS